MRVAKERKEIYQFDSENPVLIRRLPYTRRPTPAPYDIDDTRSTILQFASRVVAGRFQALRLGRYNRDRRAFDAESEIIQRAKLRCCERRARCRPPPSTEKRSPSPRPNPRPVSWPAGRRKQCWTRRQGSQTLSSFVLIDLRSRYSRSERDFALQRCVADACGPTSIEATQRDGSRLIVPFVDPSTVLQSNSPAKNGIMTSSAAAAPLSAVAPRLTGQDWGRPAIDCGSSGTRMYFLRRVRFRPLAESILGEGGRGTRTRRGRDWEIKTEQTDYSVTRTPSTGELVCINAPRQTTN